MGMRHLRPLIYTSEHATSSHWPAHLRRRRSRESLGPATTGSRTHAGGHALWTSGSLDAPQPDRSAPAHRRAGRATCGYCEADRGPAPRAENAARLAETAPGARRLCRSSRANGPTHGALHARARRVPRRPSRRAGRAHGRSAGPRLGDDVGAACDAVCACGDARPARRSWPRRRAGLQSESRSGPRRAARPGTSWRAR